MSRYLGQANSQLQDTTCSLTIPDVSCSDPDYGWIHRFFDNNITSGCGITNPDSKIPVSGTVTLNGTVYPYNCVSGGTSAFSDVLPTDPYCIHIHYIAVLGITVGCGTDGSGHPIFCETANTTEENMMAFTYRGWPTYFGVPRGTIYTIRDHNNRVETEMTSYPGTTTTDPPIATAPGRDNVFFGNLLAGSYVNSSLSGTLGWSYAYSDHLGTPRLIEYAAGGNEKHKYWPYGDEVSPVAPTQKLSFALMERDTESNHFYDHARSHDFNLGRFVSVDKHTGHAANPLTWNRYTYARNNPLALFDPNGLEPQGAVDRLSWGVSAWLGSTAAYDAALRGGYVRAASGLKDSAARTALKLQVREWSDPVARSIADAMRPIADEASRVGGTVTKTNEAVNNAMGLAGRVGTGFTFLAAGISLYNVATAPEGQQGATAAREGGAWTGALSFGWAGAEMGAVVGGPVGAVVGGVVGSAVGAVAGSQAGENTFHLFAPSAPSSGGCSDLFGCGVPPTL